MRWHSSTLHGHAALTPHLGLDTTHAGHAKEIAAALPLEYDAVVTVSGDGSAYEVINGFAERLDAKIAFNRTAVVPIPSGSANAFSLNLLGSKVSSPDICSHMIRPDSLGLNG